MLQYDSMGAEGPPTVGIWRSCQDHIDYVSNENIHESLGERTGSDRHRTKYTAATIATTAYNKESPIRVLRVESLGLAEGVGRTVPGRLHFECSRTPPMRRPCHWTGSSLPIRSVRHPMGVRWDYTPFQE